MAKMGRKPRDGVTRETLNTFKLSKDEAKRIEDLAKYLDIPKSVYIRNIVIAELEEMEYLKKTGALAIGKKIIKTSDFLKEWMKIKKTHKIIEE